MGERFSIGLVLVLVLSSLGLGGLFYAASEPEPAPTASRGVPMAVPQAADPALLATAGHVDQAGQANTGATLPDPEPLRSGRWGPFERGQLRPNSDLRGHFDQLLAERTGQEWPETRSELQALAAQDLGAEGAQAVVRIWDSYLNLLIWDETLQHQSDLKALTPEKWIASRQDFFRQARATMGTEWADAFFAEDEAQIQQLARSQQEQQVSAGLRDPGRSTPSQ